MGFCSTPLQERWVSPGYFLLHIQYTHMTFNSHKVTARCSIWYKYQLYTHCFLGWASFNTAVQAHRSTSGPRLYVNQRIMCPRQGIVHLRKNDLQVRQFYSIFRTVCVDLLECLLPQLTEGVLTQLWNSPYQILPHAASYVRKVLRVRYVTGVARGQMEFSCWHENSSGGSTKRNLLTTVILQHSFSLTLIKSGPVQDVCTAATWLTLQTFSRFYTDNIKPPGGISHLWTPLQSVLMSLCHRLFRWFSMPLLRRAETEC